MASTCRGHNRLAFLDGIVDNSVLCLVEEVTDEAVILESICWPEGKLRLVVDAVFPVVVMMMSAGGSVDVEDVSDNGDNTSSFSLSMDIHTSLDELISSYASISLVMID